MDPKVIIFIKGIDKMLDKAKIESATAKGNCLVP